MLASGLSCQPPGNEGGGSTPEPKKDAVNTKKTFLGSAVVLYFIIAVAVAELPHGSGWGLVPTPVFKGAGRGLTDPGAGCSGTTAR